MKKTNDICCQHFRETMDRMYVYFDLLCDIVSNLMAATTKTGFTAVKEARLSFLGFISGILIILFSITGCTESPYTGSILELSDVDQYISQSDNELLCLQSKSDAACLKLIPKIRSTDNIKVPTIHIHPQKLVYIFYHEGRQILRAERAIDTREVVKALTTGTDPDPLPPDGDVLVDGSDNDPSSNIPLSTNNNPPGQDGANNDDGDTNGGNTPPLGSGNPPSSNPPLTNNDPPGQDGANNDDGNTNGGNTPPLGGGNPPSSNPPLTNNNPPGSNNPPPINQNPVSSDRSIDAHHVYNDGWIIWVDFPEGTEPTGIPVLERSGLTIRINGVEVTSDDISGFAQVESYDGTKGIQFFYPTGEANSSQLEIEVDGLVEDEETVKFSMNSPVETSPEHVTYQTNPL